MKKKIIALSIAAALTTPALVLADTANVTVYGLADLSLDMVKTGDGSAGTAATKGTTQRRVSSNVSRLGLKGSEPLGDGLTALWQMEGTVAMDVGTSALFDRNTFIGVEGGFGRVVLGKHDTPYKIATRKLDVFADSIADNRSMMGGVTGKSASVGFDGRPSDVLAYISPTVVGISGAIALVNISEQNTLNTQTSTTATSLAVMYGQGPIYASFGYETHNIAPNVGASTSEKAIKLGFGFAKEVFSVGAVVEKTSDDLNPGAANKYGHTGITVNGKFNITANDAVKAAVVMAGKQGSPAGGANTSAKQVSVGYDHSMSKRTTVYAILTKLSNDNNMNYGLYGGGGAAGYNINVGASPMALSLGVKHSF